MFSVIYKNRFLVSIIEAVYCGGPPSNAPRDLVEGFKEPAAGGPLSSPPIPISQEYPWYSMGWEMKPETPNTIYSLAKVVIRPEQAGIWHYASELTFTAYVLEIVRSSSGCECWKLHRAFRQLFGC